MPNAISRRANAIVSVVIITVKGSFINWGPLYYKNEDQLYSMDFMYFFPNGDFNIGKWGPKDILFPGRGNNLRKNIISLKNRLKHKQMPNTLVFIIF